MHVYLDHAASSPPRPEAQAALREWLPSANASATHTAGQDARAAVEEARERVADALGCSPHEVIFTAGGTEADNLAIKGVVWAARERRRGVPHLVTTAVEHPAVLEPARWLADRGEATLSVVEPQPDGQVPLDRVLAAVREDTVLVSVMAANNELGAVNDIAGLGAHLRERGVPLHCDAVQALGTLPVDVGSWNVDALSVSGHKIGAPQGVGTVVLRRGLGVEPLLHGGGQDRGVRSGTFAVGLAAALGAGLRAAVDDRAALADRLRGWTDTLAAALLPIDQIVRNGPVDPAWRLPSHLHLGLTGVDPAALTLALDRYDIAASTGSACGAGAAAPSHVLAATGTPGTPLRISLGWSTNALEVELAADRLRTVLAELVGSHRAVG